MIDFIFYTIYAIIKSIEGGYASQSDSRRALFSVYVIGVLVLLDIVAVFQLNLSFEHLIAFWVIIVLILYFAFVFKKRYLEIVSKFRGNWRGKSFHQILVSLFVVISIAYFIMRNPL